MDAECPAAEKLYADRLKQRDVVKVETQNEVRVTVQISIIINTFYSTVYSKKKQSVLFTVKIV